MKKSLLSIASLFGALSFTQASGMPTRPITYTLPIHGGSFGGGKMPTFSRRHETKGVKNHRRLYSLPCWKRDGFKDSASYVAAHAKATA